MAEMKQRHFEKFLKSIKPDVEGCNIKFNQGEREYIMLNYVKDFHNNSFRSDNLQSNYSMNISDSVKFNTDTIKRNKPATSKTKRVRPKTVAAEDAR